MTTHNQPEEFVSYDDVLLLLQNNQKVDYDLPEGVSGLWQIQNHPDLPPNASSFETKLLLKKELNRWNKLLAKVNPKFAYLLDQRFEQKLIDLYEY